eukprot:TRINITY_DN959_c0_g1_i4.p1 TRINITY_DN959_c0_g1~~TRINITY_DN959_c0_g1_i4.p1  ORF type:complete len:805 (-),score=143.59 TRINITY_DN959_c0_g1_i4:750-3164(-)
MCIRDRYQRRVRDAHTRDMSDAPVPTLTPKKDEEEDKQDGNCFQQFSRSFFERIGDGFACLGAHIGENPWYFVIAVAVIGAGLAVGMSMLDLEGRAEELWMPSDSEAATDKDTVDAYYPRTSRVETVILVPSDGDITTVANFNLMLSAYNDLAAVTAEYSGSTLTWSNMCTTVGTYCRAVNGLEPFGYVVPATKAQILAQLNSIPDGTSRLLQMQYGTQVDSSTVLGGIATDASNNIVSAQAAKLIFYVRNDQQRSSDGGWETPDAEAWEKEWLKVAENLQLGGITVTRFAQRTRSDEFGDALSADIMMVNVAVVVLLFYCMLTIGKLRKPETRVSLTFLGIVSVGLAYIAGLGLVNGFIGVKYTPLHGVLTFLLLGLGVDDMFVITAAFDETNPSDPIPQRVAESLRHSGSAVMLTSVTDTIAFLIGSITILPALRYFCLSAGVCIFFIFVFQVFLFVPFLVLDERRRADGRNDVFCCGRTCCGDSCICSGSGDLESPTQAVAPVGAAKAASVHPENEADDDERRNCVNMRVGFIRRVLGKASGPLVLNPWGNVATIAAFLIMLGFGVVGLALLKADADTDQFIPGGSYAHDYFNADDDYFTTVGVPADAYLRNPNYWTKSAEMASLKTSLEGNEYVVSSTVDSWYSALVTYNTNTPCTATTEANWYTCLDAFLATSTGGQYRRHIVFEDNTATGSPANPIVISRITANHKVLDNSNDQVKGMDSFRGTVENFQDSLLGSLGDPFGYGPRYPSYEGYKVIEQEAYRNIALALASILLIVVILVPNIGTFFRELALTAPQLLRR